MMADIAKVKRNVARMIEQGAPESEVDAYVSGEGVSAADLRAAPNEQSGSVMSSIDRVVRAVANGVTLGAADRIAAGIGSLTGIGGTQGDYAGNLKREQDRTEQFAEEHPYQNLAANMVGGAVVPLGAIGAASRAATMGGKMALGAGAGAGLGGVQGAMESRDLTDWEAARNAAKGAGVGGVVGAAIPGAARIIGGGYNAVANAVRGHVPEVSRPVSRHLMSAMEADTPAAVQARMAHLGPEAMLVDAGPSFLGKAQGASLNSDAGRSVLQNTLTARNQGTNARIMDDVERALGPAEDPQTVTNAIRATRSATDDVNYGRALGHAAQPVDTSGVLSNLGPMIGQSVGMEQRALSNLRDMLMVNQNGVIRPQTDPRVLHRIKGELDNVIEFDAPGLGIPAAAVARQQGALRQMRGQINAALERQVPGYREANAASSALARRAEAVEAGTQYLGNGKTTSSPARFADEFSQLEPGEQIAFAKGSRGNIDRVLGTKANDLQALRGELQGEGGWNTAKLATVHGRDAADELVNSVDRNLAFRDSYNKVVENSQTAQRQAAANAMKPTDPAAPAFIGPGTTAAGAAMTASKNAVQAIASALVRRDPTQHYGELASVLTKTGSARDQAIQDIMEALKRRKGNSAVTAMMGDRTSLAAAIAAYGASRTGPTRSRER